MYTGDHIVLSTSLAIVAAQRLNLKLVPLITVLALLNFIDIDHVFTRQLDNGFANSLTIHYLHVYSGCIIFAMALFALFDQKHIKFYLALIAGWSLHLTADAVAYFVHYSIPVLFCLAIFFLIVLALIIKTFVVGRRWLLFGYIFLSWLICTSAQAYLYFGLKLIPQQSIIVWVMPNILLVILMSGFYLLFRHSTLTTKNPF